MHRQDALAACKDAIDTLKETMPLWKKEVYGDGEGVARARVVAPSHWVRSRA